MRDGTGDEAWRWREGRGGDGDENGHGDGGEEGGRQGKGMRQGDADREGAPQAPTDTDYTFFPTT